MEYEHSDRARYVTTLVSMWIENDGNFYFLAQPSAKYSPEYLGVFLTDVLKSAGHGSAPWHTAQELCPNDFTNNRIHWDEIARNLLAE